MERVNLVIDGININASHFAAIAKAGSDEKAVDLMIADGFAPGDTDEEKRKWASDALPKLKEAVEKIGKKEEKTIAATEKEAAKATSNASKAEAGVGLSGGPASSNQR